MSAMATRLSIGQSRMQTVCAHILVLLDLSQQFFYDATLQTATNSESDEEKEKSQEEGMIDIDRYFG